jgi:tRNA threonylcarbamoyladenosine biosynthesis protein TsaB
MSIARRAGRGFCMFRFSHFCETMRVLGIDTSTMTAGVGLVENDEVLVDINFDVKVTYSEILMPTIEETLKMVGLRVGDLDGFAICIGPGSFTGLRIGLSTIKGLSFATGKPLACVPSLDALASRSLFCRYQVAPLLDAKKNEVYAAFYETGDGKVARKSDFWATDIVSLAGKVSMKTLFVGPGARLYQKELVDLLGKKVYFALGEQSTPSGASVARIGTRKLASGQTEDVSQLEPLYIRKSETELKFKNVDKG